MQNPRATRSNLDVALDYPLAAGVSIWGVVMGVLVLCGFVPSHTIQALPHVESIAWAALLAAASGSILFGLFWSRSVLAVARGMFALAIAITIYWISIINVSGWHDGGAVASFLLVISLVYVREGEALRKRTEPRSGGERAQSE